MSETPTPETDSDRRSTATRLLPWLLGLLGAALAGYGASTHITIAARTNCDGCAPWHPLFVLAPLVLGGLLVVVAGVIHART